MKITWIPEKKTHPVKKLCDMKPGDCFLFENDGETFLYMKLDIDSTPSKMIGHKTPILRLDQTKVMFVSCDAEYELLSSNITVELERTFV